jgi:hypothetical protein
MLLDGVFGARFFRNDIVWKRRVGSFSTVHTSRQFGDCYDDLLFYTKSEESVFNAQYSKDAKGYQEYLETRFNMTDENGRRYQLDNLANPAPRPNLMYEYKGYKTPANGWAISREKMEQWEKEGRLTFRKTKRSEFVASAFSTRSKGNRCKRSGTISRRLTRRLKSVWDFQRKNPSATRTHHQRFE